MAAGRSDERGAVVAFMAMTFVVVLICCAFVFEGSRRRAALSEARDLADNAARAGARHVDLDEFRDGAVPVVDVDMAIGAAQEYLAAAGASPGLVIVDGEFVIVQVQVEVEGYFIPGTFVATATETSEAVAGVTVRGG